MNYTKLSKIADSYKEVVENKYIDLFDELENKYDVRFLNEDEERREFVFKCYDPNCSEVFEEIEARYPSARFDADKEEFYIDKEDFDDIIEFKKNLHKNADSKRHISKKKLRDALNKRRQAVKKSFKLTDSYKSLKKRVADEFVSTETTEDAVNVAVELLKDAPAEQVVSAAIEVLAETIDRLTEEHEEVVVEEVEEQVIPEEVEEHIEEEEVVETPDEEVEDETVEEEVVDSKMKVQKQPVQKKVQKPVQKATPKKK